jgi:hypothetical protein
MKMSLYVAAAAIVVASVVVLQRSSRDADEGIRARTPTSTPTVGQSRERVDPASDSEPEPPPSERAEEGRVAVAAATHPDEDELSRRWDSLSKAERVQVLRKEFNGAVNAIRRGADFERNRAVADSALSSLRGEIYGAQVGGRSYQQLEQELDTLVQRHREAARPATETE